MHGDAELACNSEDLARPKIGGKAALAEDLGGKEKRFIRSWWTRLRMAKKLVVKPEKRRNPGFTASEYNSGTTEREKIGFLFRVSDARESI